MASEAARVLMAGAPRISETVRRIEQVDAPLRGRVQVPGSKSHSTRSLVLAAIAQEPVLLRNLLHAEDPVKLAGALEVMGAGVTRLFGDDWLIDGRGLRSAARAVVVNLGDGGAPARFTLALAAMRAGETVVDGSERLRERPIADGVNLLRAIGVRCEYVEAEGRLPVRVHGMGGPERRGSGAASAPGALGPMAASERRAHGPQGADPAPLVEVGRTASSQFVSALLLVAPALPHGLRLRFSGAPTSAPYLRLTVECLRRFGARVDGVGGDFGAEFAAGCELRVHGGLSPPREYCVPADASSAVVWAAAAAMIPGSRIELPGVVRDLQPDVAAIETIGRMGARLHWQSDRLTVESAPLHGIDISAEGWPDGALAVTAAATSASGVTRLRDLGTLRVKESDRLAVLASEFTRLGATVRVEGDDLLIQGDPTLNATAACAGSSLGSSAGPSAADRSGAPIVEADPHRDHRIAMSLALLALRRGGVRLRNPSCVAKSYPAFWRDLDRLVAGRALG